MERFKPLLFVGMLLLFGSMGLSRFSSGQVRAVDALGLSASGWDLAQPWSASSFHSWQERAWCGSGSGIVPPRARRQRNRVKGTPRPIRVDRRKAG
jgi:hypothetical protein